MKRGCELRENALTRKKRRNDEEILVKSSPSKNRIVNVRMLLLTFKVSFLTQC